MFVVLGLTQIPLFVVFGLTQIPQISLNCIDDVKSHRIVWWESRGVFLAHTDLTDLTELH